MSEIYGKEECINPQIKKCYYWPDYMDYEVCIDCIWYISEKIDLYKEMVKKKELVE